MPPAMRGVPGADGRVRPGVILVTGMPGAGKTALIGRLAEGEPERVRILLPAHGGGDIDARILATILDGPDRIARHPPGVAAPRVNAGERLFIETDGLADPAPLVARLVPATLPVIITVVDALHILDQLGRHAAAAEQVAFADVLVLTRLDMVRPEGLDAIRRRLRTLNPDAAIRKDDEVNATTALADPDGGRLARLVAAAQARGALDHHHEDDDHRHSHGDGHGHGHGHVHSHDHHHGTEPDGAGHEHFPGGFDLVVLRDDRPMDRDRLVAWVSGLVDEAAGGIIRVKGIAPVDGGTRLIGIETVQMIVEANWLPRGGARRADSLFAVTGRGLDRAGLARGLAGCAIPSGPEELT